MASRATPAMRLAYDMTTKGRAQRLWSSAQVRAKRDNLEFTLTLKYLADKMERCAATDIPFDYARGAGGGFGGTNAFAPSLDRIDNTRGYTEDNVHVVCWIYNRAKLTDPHNVVLRFAKALVETNAGFVAP